MDLLEEVGGSGSGSSGTGAKDVLKYFNGEMGATEVLLMNLHVVLEANLEHLMYVAQMNRGGLALQSQKHGTGLG